jgi:hypothetical protein
VPGFQSFRLKRLHGYGFANRERVEQIPDGCRGACMDIQLLTCIGNEDQMCADLATARRILAWSDSDRIERADQLDSLGLFCLASDSRTFARATLGIGRDRACEQCDDNNATSHPFGTHWIVSFLAA